MTPVNQSSPRFSRFDTAVFLTMIGLLLLTALFIWRGDRVGLQVVQLSPADGAVHASTQATVQITFSQDVDTASAVSLQINPPVEGQARWDGRTLTFVPATPLAPDTRYTVTLPTGLRSRQGRPLLQPITWQFQTGRPRLLYLAWDESNSGNQLYVIAPDGGRPEQLTQSEFHVLDYAVSPDDGRIVYSLARADGGSDLWIMTADGLDNRLLLACPEGACSRPAWAPGGQRLIYERRTAAAPNSPPGPPRLWWLDVSSGETVAVFADSQWLGFSVNFSGDGRWISYVSPLTQGIQAYNLVTGEYLLIPSRTGEPADWSPNGDSLLLTQLELDSTDFNVYLMRVDVPAGTTTQLSGEEAVNDAWPAWSPDGEWIAMTRKPPRAAVGSQIWRLRSDGREAEPLTANPNVHHGPPIWSPDGRFIVFQQFTLSNPEMPGIWLLDVETRATHEVVTPGIQPAWLP